MSHIIDISQTLINGIAVWPGDTNFETRHIMRIDRGDPCNVGSVMMSLHTGTHTDAPYHFLADGAAIADADLSVYVGPAVVIDLRGAGSVEPHHLTPLQDDPPERVLFRTRTTRDTSVDPQFCYLSPAAAQALVGMGVRLVGIDTPSVDKSDSETHSVHMCLAAANVAILENLALDQVGPGPYELIALPLKLAGMDASPVRAVLRTL